MIVSDEYFVNFIDGTLNSDKKIRIIRREKAIFYSSGVFSRDIKEVNTWSLLFISEG